MEENDNSLELRFNPLIEKLKEYLKSAKKRNGHFSLRAFARKIEMAPSTLSTLINFPKRLTSDQIERIGGGLGISNEEIEGYKKFYSLGSQSLNANRKCKTLTPDEALLLAPWHVGALFELMKCRCFRYDLPWLEQSLGVSASKIIEATKSLCDVGLISINEQNQITMLYDMYEFSAHSTNTCSEELKKAMIDLGRLSVEALAKDLPRDKRFHSSLVMPFHTSNLMLIKKLSDRFRLQISNYSDQFSEINDQVYALTLSCYPLTNHEHLAKSES